MAEKIKIGIMGGTFDPIHVGHLMTAEAVRDEYDLDKVLFIPAYIPPHKQGEYTSSAHHRYIMTVLATCSNPNFEVSDIEMKREGPSYSVDTVRTLKEIYGDNTEFYFITGADAIQELGTWNRVEELLSMCHFIGASRPGCISDLEKVKEHFGQLGYEKIHQLATPELEISSTDIRDRMRNNYSIKYIVPTAVEQYILKNSLYK